MASVGDFLSNMLLGALSEGQAQREEARKIHTAVLEKVLEKRLTEDDPMKLLSEILLAKQLDPNLDLSKVTLRGGKIGFDLGEKKLKDIPAQSRRYFDLIDSELANLSTTPLPPPGPFDFFTQRSQIEQEKRTNRIKSLKLQRQTLYDQLKASKQYNLEGLDLAPGLDSATELEPSVKESKRSKTETLLAHLVKEGTIQAFKRIP